MASAGLGRRLVAVFVDWFASLLVALLAFPTYGYGSTNSMAATLAIFALEIVVLTWLTGASFGQRLLGLRVVLVSGDRVGIFRVALRTALLCLVIPAVVFDSEGRGLHDRAAGSRVIRVRSSK